METFEFLFTMKGPDFLVFYGVWLIVTRVAVAVLRHQGHDSRSVTFGGLAVYGGVGVLRMWVGATQGMHRWEGLIVMMIAGAFIFFIRARDFGNHSSGGSCSGGISAGGGCGSGGGCGGGGCGGCGGS